MSISYCHRCRVEAVQHLIIPFARDDRSKYNVNESEVYRWSCNNCRYTSLRSSRENNTPQFYPIVPKGNPLSEKIPESIHKDFDEARLVANYSIRCGNVLLRTCVEKICTYIVENFAHNSLEEYCKLRTLHNKIEFLYNHKDIHFIDDEWFEMLKFIKNCGNDIHDHKKIEDSDTEKTFETLMFFVNQICKEIVARIERSETIKKIKP